MYVTAYCVDLHIYLLLLGILLWSMIILTFLSLVNFFNVHRLLPTKQLNETCVQVTIRHDAKVHEKCPFQEGSASLEAHCEVHVPQMLYVTRHAKTRHIPQYVILCYRPRMSI